MELESSSPYPQVNTKHCSQNFKSYSQEISLFSDILFFRLIALTTLEPNTSLPSSTFTLSVNTCPMPCRSTTSSVACEHKDRSLVNTRVTHCPAVRWLPCHPLDASYIGVSWFPCHLLDASCIAVRIFHRYRALSHFSDVRHASRQRYPSLSLEYTRRLLWSSTLECSISFSHENCLFNWHSRSCCVRGFTGCILLGATASCYNIISIVFLYHHHQP
jgi:hypothetical protein